MSTPRQIVTRIMPTRLLTVLITCLTLFIAALPTLADDTKLDVDAIRAIVLKPHSPKLTVKALDIYPVGRRFRVEVKHMPTEGDAPETKPFDITEKWVDGKYIVSTIPLPDVNKTLYMVVTFDKKTNTYRKFVMDPDGNVHRSVGIRHGDKRVISWSGPLTDEGPAGLGTLLVGQEHFTDTTVVWTETLFIDGELVFRQEGKATVIKK